MTNRDKIMRKYTQAVISKGLLFNKSVSLMDGLSTII